MLAESLLGFVEILWIETPLGLTGRNELISGGRTVPHFEMFGGATYRPPGNEAFIREKLRPHVG
jgi:hypothetical protein